MTSQSSDFQDRVFKISVKSDAQGAERRQHRRHDFEQAGVEMSRVDARSNDEAVLGRIMDLSAGGVRIRTDRMDVRPDHQIRVRIELPAYAGISPFIDRSSGEPTAKREWTGWMAVARVQKVNDKQADVAGRLVDMDDIDRGMLGLYLSTQPLAA